jgi:hypothetical protein
VQGVLCDGHAIVQAVGPIPDLLAQLLVRVGVRARVGAGVGVRVRVGQRARVWVGLRARV